MTANYYIDELSAEWEAVERWENEGGRLSQNHDTLGFGHESLFRERVGGMRFEL